MRATILCGLLLTARVAAAQTPAAPAAQPAPYPPYGAPITLEQARPIVAAAVAEARRLGYTMAFAVVEPSGALVAFERMDGTQYGSIDVAQAKARTAARFRRSTKVFADMLQGGNQALLTLPGVVTVEGGVPVLVGGRIVGALGISGGTSVQDGQVAAIALQGVR